MKNDIAIIGVSGRFPEANNLKDLYQNLREGRDSSRPLSRDRILKTTIPTNAKYKSIAYIDDIDCFDHAFFNISLREAEQMDPHQRLLLEEAYLALESTGYSVEHFKDSNTGVFLSTVALNYYKHAEVFDPNLVTGNSSSISAGRISRFFGLRGKSLMIDTACSSSLVAIHLACNDLILGEIETALVGSANLILFPPEVNGIIDIGTSSSDGKTRSFSANADGAGSGELVACVILKRLEDALKDNDIIYSIIKGTATNQDAHLSGSLTSPSSTAQSEVIEAAWLKSNIEPTSISYIEAHGSATKLGDPNEITGINLAFNKYSDKKQICAISTIKTNIGHTNNSAGMAGVIKTILSIRNKELFPSLHFEKPNPFIDFNSSSVFVNSSLQEWKLGSQQVRRAGVSSFGISGTNCHVVMEEYQNVEQENITEITQPLFFAISGKSFNSLIDNVKSIIDFSKNTDFNFTDFNFTLNSKKQYEYRIGVIASSLDDLIKKLDNSLTIEKRILKKEKKIIFVFSEVNILLSDIKKMGLFYPSFNYNLNKCLNILKDKHSYDKSKLYQFVFQYSYYNLLADYGINSINFVGSGIGKVIIEVITELIDFEDGLLKAIELENIFLENFENRIKALIEKETENINVVFIEIGPLGNISKILDSPNHKNDFYDLNYLNLNDENNFLEAFKNLYLSGVDIKWDSFLKTASGKRIPFIPLYQFEKKRCWIKNEYTEIVESTNETEIEDSPNEIKTFETQYTIDKNSLYEHENNTTWTETQNKVGAIWKWLLKSDNISLDDDFFILGGHSLYSIHMMNKIQEEFGVKVSFNNIFNFSSIRMLSEFIELASTNISTHEIDPELLPIAEMEYYETTRAQKRLWVLDNFEEEKMNYLVPNSFMFKGKINIQALKEAFRLFITRHESLRTIFVSIEGELKQKVLLFEEINFELVEVDIRNEIDKEEKIQSISFDSYNTPFNLEEGPLIRAKLIIVEEDKYFMLIMIHHIVSDGWSIEIMRIELKRIYHSIINNLEMPLESLKIQAKDYAYWSNQLIKSKRFELHKSYWLKQFEGPLQELQLQLDYPRPEIKSPYGNYIVSELDKEISEKLKEYNRQNGITLYMTIYSVMYALLYRYTNQVDIILGSYISGRNRPELENQFGFYVNTLAIRSVFNGQDSFKKLVEIVKTNLVNAYDNQLYQFDMLIEDLKVKRKLNRNPLFDVGIEYKNTYEFLSDENEKKKFLDGIILSNEEIDWCTSKSDITLRIYDMGESISLKFEYNPGLFKKETIELFKDRYIKIIELIINDSEIAISELPLTIIDSNKTNLKLFKNNFNYAD